MKLRVISGSLGGRQFDSPAGNKTHPMSEKIRGALFNMLGDVANLSFLDAFAGSGAISIEAISRGASHSVAIDADKSAYSSVVKNTQELGISSSIKATRANVSSWSDNNPDEKFDIVVCDPPYDQIKPDLIQKLSRHVTECGLMVLSLPPKNKFNPGDSFTRIAAKNYGDAELVIYRETG